MKKKTIAVLMSFAIDSYQQSILRGLEDYSKEENFRLLYFYGKPLRTGERNNGFDNPIFELINQEEIHGMVSMSAAVSEFIGQKKMEEFLDQYEGIPIVSIGMEIPGASCITVDNRAGIEEIMEHLVHHHGCKKIACIRGPKNNIEAEERFKAYRSFLENQYMGFDETLVYQGNFQPGDGVHGICYLLDETGKSFDAVLCEDDYAALEVIRELRNRQIRVPEDMAVFGFDNIESSAFSSPPLSTMDQPLYHMGSEAGKKLKAIFSGRKDSENLQIDPVLIARESCGCSDNRGKHIGSMLQRISNTDWNSGHIFQILEQRYSAVVSENEKVLENIPYLEEFLGQLKDALDVLLLHDDITPLFEISRVLMHRCLNAQISFRYLEKILSQFFEDRQNCPPLQILWDQIVYFLLEEENSCRGATKRDFDQLIAQHREISNRMLSCFSFEDLKKVLEQSINLLRMKSVLLFLFKSDIYEVELTMALGSGFEQMENRTFQFESLFHELENKGCLRSYHLHPLVSDEKHQGFLLLETIESPGEFNDSFAENICHSVETIQHMQRLNSYTEELEMEVKRRTEELEAANKLLKSQAYHDHLSGLHNRRFLNDIIIPEANRLVISQVYRNRKNDKRDLNPNTTFGLFLIDLDFFKDVNDSYGHDSGDMVIQQLSNLFRKQCRQDDYIIRFGGEEFIVIMRNFDPNYLEVKAEQIRQAVETHSFQISDDREIKKTCSIGCMIFPGSLEHPNAIAFHDAVVLVDKAMYYAKENGRNQARILEIAPKLLAAEDIQTELIDKFEEHLEEGSIKLLNASDK